MIAGTKAGTSAAGMLLLLGFSATWGLYVVFVRRNLSAYPAHLAYGLVSVLTGIPLVGLMFAFGQWAALGQLTLAQWGWLALSALLGLTLGHVLYYRAIRVMGKLEPIYCEAVHDLPATLLNVLQEGDVVLTMGAGSINKAAQALAEGSR